MYYKKFGRFLNDPINRKQFNFFKLNSIRRKAMYNFMWISSTKNLYLFYKFSFYLDL